MTKLAIIDYGVGNLGSLIHACNEADCNPVLLSNKADLEKTQATHLILPGVGAVGEALRQLRQRDMEEPLNTLVKEKGTLLLAICVGLQMLAETCIEFGEHKGLGWIEGSSTDRIVPLNSDLILPHVGWNDITLTSDHGGLLEDLDGENFYFVHSYSINCSDKYSIATTEYGPTINCAVRAENIFGVQFHPEKSSRAGARLLSNFLAL
jgi:imidazole glycerol-phosphate synthase subunit HisH